MSINVLDVTFAMGVLIMKGGSYWKEPVSLLQAFSEGHRRGEVATERTDLKMERNLEMNTSY